MNVVLMKTGTPSLLYRIRDLQIGIAYSLFARSIRCTSFALVILLVLAFATSSFAQKRSAADESRLRAYTVQLIPQLPEFVQSTVNRIPDAARRLLAMGTYFRRLNELEGDWAWTSEEIAAFKLTDEYAKMLVEIEKVRRAFAEQNPGYSLDVHVAARSLGTQISKWNSVSSVSRAAREFGDSCVLAMADTILFPASPDSAALRRFRDFLEVCELQEDRVPTVAVPGLSKHGQLRAFDFKIKKGKKLIAGTTSSTISSLWDGAGWTEKLHQAIITASNRLEGPLPSPYEPWHYTYHHSDDLASGATPSSDQSTEGISSEDDSSETPAVEETSESSEEGNGSEIEGVE